MTAIDTLIADLQAGQYSTQPQNIIAPVADFVAALQFIASGLTPAGPEAANTVYAGPASGPAALPTFRALVTADLGTTMTPQFASIGVNQAAPATAGQVSATGATTTSPGFYTLLSGDAGARVRVGLNSTDGASIALGSGAATRDCFIERVAAANIRLGPQDAAAPTAQTLSMQNVVAGTANTAGTNFTLQGSLGTGSAAGGSIILATSGPGSVGSAQNAATNIATFAVPAASTAAMLISTTPFTGGSGTTTFPTTLYQATGTTAATSWSTGGTFIGINAPSGFAGNYLDLHINGGVSFFSISGGGVTTNGVWVGTATGAPSALASSIKLGATAAGGAIITGSGTSTDLIFTGAAGTVFSVPHNTTNLTVAGGVTVGSATLLTGTAGFTNNAGASAGTLTNAPTAGNPTKWIPINDNGTTRNIPAW